jgi:ubiquinone/menaquinone biosynthesis C-methylase UbiE
MKKSTIIALCVISNLNGMDQPAKREPREWPAKEYSKGNKNQIACFSQWMEKYKIPTQDKTIVSFGCGTGEIEAELAKKARHVHGTDASNNMIDHAKKTHGNRANNLFFTHCFAEDFTSQPVYDLALASCCFHWFADQPKAVKAIANSLKSEGLFFANIDTATNAKPLGLVAYEEMMNDYPIINNVLSILPNPTGSTHPTYGELHIMLFDAGLTDIKSSVETYDCIMTEEELRQMQLPILLSSPGAQTLINTTSDNWLAQKAANSAFWWISMSDEEKQQHNAPFFPESNNPLVQKIRTNDFCRYLFNNFLNRFKSKMQKNEDGTYTWKYETTIICAQKKDNS